MPIPSLRVRGVVEKGRVERRRRVALGRELRTLDIVGVISVGFLGLMVGSLSCIGRVLLFVVVIVVD